MILRDSEAFLAGAQVLEYVGQTISRKIKIGLRSYENEIWLLAKETGIDETEFRRVFGVIVTARNDAVHDGAWARHLSTRVVDLLLILEEGVTMKMNRVEDLMVRDPIRAEGWHLMNHLRKKMLESSFSHLPFVDDQANWFLVSDVNLMLFMRANPKSHLSLSEAVQNGSLALVPAQTCHGEELIVDILTKTKQGPLLVIDDAKPTRLVGILTAFDLL